MVPLSELHRIHQGTSKSMCCLQCHVLSLSNRGMSAWVMLFLAMSWAAESTSCPKECTCQHLAVNCTGKQLEEFPATVPLDTRQLILAQNKLSSLPSLELNFLSDLIYLDCSGNALGEDLDFTFVSLVRLVYLDLSFNNLTQVTFGTFSQLSSLVVLKLSDNPGLVEIERDSFANNTWLRHLDVSRCSLTFIDSGTMKDLPNLRSLDLSGNPWFCNCSFMELCSWMKGSGVTIRVPVLYWSKFWRDFDPAKPVYYVESVKSRESEWTFLTTEKKGLFSRAFRESQWTTFLTMEGKSLFSRALASDNVTCYSPAFVHGLRMLEEAQEELHYKCYIHFDHRDYLFLGLVGFCIFSAGTVLAWLFGVCAVIYAFLKGTEDDEEQEQEEEETDD